MVGVARQLKTLLRPSQPVVFKFIRQKSVAMLAQPEVMSMIQITHHDDLTIVWAVAVPARLTAAMPR